MGSCPFGSDSGDSRAPIYILVVMEADFYAWLWHGGSSMLLKPRYLIVNYTR